MKGLNFIFTKNGFHLDETKEENTSSWAILFKKYYRLKISQGKGHRCAQGHCIRKLLRIIYHLLETGQSFDPALLR